MVDSELTLVSDVVEALTSVVDEVDSGMLDVDKFQSPQLPVHDEEMGPIDGVLSLVETVIVEVTVVVPELIVGLYTVAAVKPSR